MNRRFLAAALVAGAAAAVLWQTNAGAAAKKPVALQYDEIVRMVIVPNTPPPPGVFQTDYAAIMNGVSTSSSATPGATPTPAPKRHGLFGVLQQVVTGVPSGGDSSDGNPYANQAMNAMKRLQEGNLVRYTFYKNWLRTDDPVNRTATISKCDIHQFISLDLAKRTYSISNTAPVCNTETAPRNYDGPRGQVVENEARGTGDITITASATNLGPKTLDGIPTTGWDRSMGYAETNSTGSCKDSNMSMKTLAYVSQIVPPRRYCPLPHSSYVRSSPESVIVHGGCKPRMHGAMSGLGATSNKLEMYLKMTMAMDQSRGPGGFASVTERGNVKWIEQSAADALFSVPPGFAKQ